MGFGLGFIASHRIIMVSFYRLCSGLKAVRFAWMIRVLGK